MRRVIIQLSTVLLSSVFWFACTKDNQFNSLENNKVQDIKRLTSAPMPVDSLEVDSLKKWQTL
jgi:hypothetical protein